MKPQRSLACDDAPKKPVVHTKSAQQSLRSHWLSTDILRLSSILGKLGQGIMLRSCLLGAVAWRQMAKPTACMMMAFNCKSRLASISLGTGKWIQVHHAFRVPTITPAYHGGHFDNHGHATHRQPGSTTCRHPDNAVNLEVPTMIQGGRQNPVCMMRAGMNTMCWRMAPLKRHPYVTCDAGAAITQ